MAPSVHSPIYTGPNRKEKAEYSLKMRLKHILEMIFGDAIREGPAIGSLRFPAAALWERERDDLRSHHFRGLGGAMQACELKHILLKNSALATPMPTEGPKIRVLVEGRVKIVAHN